GSERNNLIGTVGNVNSGHFRKKIFSLTTAAEVGPEIIVLHPATRRSCGKKKVNPKDI
ncbi:unnamed protein product, partial [Ceratitis capitata]